MRTKGMWGIGVLALSLCTTGAAQTQPVRTEKDPSPGPDPTVLKDLEDTGKLLFMMADENRDGQISQKEAIDAGNLSVGGFFFRADTNGDGILSPQEAQHARDAFLKDRPWLKYVVETAKATPKPGGSAAANPQAAFQVFETVLDTNNDRQLQATELRQGVQTIVQGMFATADTNRDNQLSPTEVNAAVDGIARSVAKGAFQAADSDHNGSVSLQEWDRAIEVPAHVVFNVLDGNHDGQLTRAETEQAEKVVISQIRSIRVPHAANAPSNLIRTGRLPSEVAPVPTLGTSDQQVQPAGSVQPRPAPR